MRKLKYIFIIILSITFLFACNESTEFSEDTSDGGGGGGSTDDAIYSLNDAWNYLDNMNYTEAENEFTGIINDEDSTAENKKAANAGMGFITYIRGNYKGAYGYFEKGLVDDFTTDVSYFTDYQKYACIGMLYCKAEKTSEAQTVYSKYPVLKNIKISWSFLQNNTDIELTGVNVHTMIAQMFINMSNGTDDETIDISTGNSSSTSNGYDDHFEYAAYHLHEVINYCKTNSISLSSKALGLIDIVEQKVDIT